MFVVYVRRELLLLLGYPWCSSSSSNYLLTHWISFLVVALIVGPRFFVYATAKPINAALFSVINLPPRFLQKNRPDLVSIMDSEKSNLPTLHLIIKADAHGSVEAIKKLLSTCPSDQCLLELGLVGVGPLTESEVEHAEALGG